VGSGAGCVGLGVKGLRCDLEHGAEEEDGREGEVARDREVVVLLLAVGQSDGGLGLGLGLGLWLWLGFSCLR